MRLIHGDCLEKMAKLPDGCVDMVLTDPPYNISRANNFHTMEGRQGLDFGEWDKGFDLFGYIKELPRILDENGSFIVFNDWKNLGDIVRFAESVGFTTKDMLRIRKRNPMPRNRTRRYVTDYECAVWFTMPKAKWVFNMQGESFSRPEFEASVKKGLHPTQKPLNVMEDLVLIHSNKGDVILDPFMGSGTTGVACANLNRDFIGIERDDKYFAIAEDRINKATLGDLY